MLEKVQQGAKQERGKLSKEFEKCRQTLSVCITPASVRHQHSILEDFGTKLDFDTLFWHKILEVHKIH